MESKIIISSILILFALFFMVMGFFIYRYNQKIKKLSMSIAARGCMFFGAILLGTVFVYLVV